MSKIRIHPLFIALAIIMTWLYGIIPFISTIIAVLLHELAHSLIARERGYVINNVVLLPYGAVLNNNNLLDKKSSILIAIAGPIANFIIAIITISFWWLIPSSYHFTDYFVKANLTIGIFNLLPVFPLDGARIVLATCNNTAKTLKILKKCGIIFSIIMFASFLVTIFIKINVTLGILAIFLYVGAISGTNREMYAHILNCSPVTKFYEHGVKQQTLYISSDLPLSRILKMVNPKHITTFIVMKNNQKVTTLTEESLLKIFTNNKLNTTLINAIKNQ